MKLIKESATLSSKGKKALKEMANYDLRPGFDKRKSFYGKARVDTGINDGQNKLYSYNTLVAEIIDGKPVVYNVQSQTTLRHVKEWLLQNGFSAVNKTQIIKDYGAEDIKVNQESLKERFNKNSKKLNETFKGQDVLDDLIDRAKSWVSDGYDIEEATHNAIDDGLIYSRDIIDLAEHYGVLDDSELISRFEEDLFNDIYNALSENEEELKEEYKNEFTIEINNDIYCDSNGEAYHFDSYAEAQEFIEEHELKNASVVRQYGKAKYEEPLNEDVNVKSLADFIQDALNGLKKDATGTYYYKLGGRFHYVLGTSNAADWSEDDLKELALAQDGNPIVGKIAVNCDDLQCDYDMDWYMPINDRTGEVWDTESAIYNDEDLNALAASIIDDYNGMKDLNLTDDGHIIEESLQEVMVDIDEDDLLDLLMNRLKRWTDDPVATDLYEQMYQSYIDSGWDLGGNSVMVIVDNDWVNYCDVVSPGDENYDALLKLYQENGLGDVSVEDVGYSFIEAATERDGTTYLLCRW